MRLPLACPACQLSCPFSGRRATFSGLRCVRVRRRAPCTSLTAAFLQPYLDPLLANSLRGLLPLLPCHGGGREVGHRTRPYLLGYGFMLGPRSHRVGGSTRLHRTRDSRPPRSSQFETTPEAISRVRHGRSSILLAPLPCSDPSTSWQQGSFLRDRAPHHLDHCRYVGHLAHSSCTDA